MEKLIHTSEGVLRTDTPWWLTPGQRVRLISLDHGNEVALKPFPLGSIFLIDEQSVQISEGSLTSSGAQSRGTHATFYFLLDNDNRRDIAFRRAFEPIYE